MYSAVIASISAVLHQEWEVAMIHTLREGNASADFLARLGAMEDDRWRLWEAPPPGLSPLLNSDAARVAFVRP